MVFLHLLSSSPCRARDLQEDPYQHDLKKFILQV